MEDKNQTREITSIDFGKMVGQDQKYEISMKNESAEDGSARRDKDAADAALKRIQSLSLFLFAMALTAVVFAGCVYTFATGAAEDKKWAAGIVTAITSGLIGFLVGTGKK